MYTPGLWCDLVYCNIQVRRNRFFELEVDYLITYIDKMENLQYLTLIYLQFCPLWLRDGREASAPSDPSEVPDIGHFKVKWSLFLPSIFIISLFFADTEAAAWDLDFKSTLLFFVAFLRIGSK